ncbi:MAG: aminotransferase class I/II-fold pyridoxal phosphate-dependent enzyme [Rhodospirillales bacterium]
MTTRRSFTAQLAWLGLAASPEAVLAQRALAPRDWPRDTVWLNANENPEGPPPASLEAIRRAAPDTWRYHFPALRDFNAVVAQSEQLSPDQVVMGAGSTEVLNLAVLVFTSATRPLITADPIFEAPAEVARALARPCIRVPLTSTYAADVRQMVAKAESAGGGLLYLCNPNNPTSSMTPRSDLAWLVSNLPRNTVALVDEAYLHFVDNYEQQSALQWVREGREVIVTRTFSKLYGMAGLRVGFACGRPDLMRQLRPFRASAISILGARAVEAALADAPKIIAQRRARTAKTRGEFCEWLDRRKLRYIKPYANFVMIEVGGDVRRIAAALAQRNIAVGRPFPPLDTMMRVTIGSDRDMARFKEAFASVMEG